MTVIMQNNTDGSTSLVDNSVTGTPEIIRFDGNRGAMGFANYVQLFDDFLGDGIADQWSGAGGANSPAAAPAISAGIEGKVRLTSGDATGTAADEGSTLSHELNWKANQGGLYLKIRANLTSVADVAVNIGFTDVKGLEEPFSISGTTITSNATDAVCFVFDTAQTNDTWHCQGVKNGTDTAISNSGVAPTAGAYQDFEIAIDTSGTATFWIDGVQVASVANAVTTTVALTPVVHIQPRTTTSKTADVDYVFVTAKRS